MDAYLILKQLEKNKKKVEQLNGSNNNSNGMTTSGLIISIILGSYAAFLSYECNTMRNIPEIQKILYATIAYLFGLVYLIYYFLFRYDICHTY